MSYAIKEIFYTLQGEGVYAGRPAVFVRFAGCNLWSGRESDRATAVCRFCDTDFVGTDGPGGGLFEDASGVAQAAFEMWPDVPGSKPFVVCTGGEPLLRLDQALVDAFAEVGFEIAIETNGTILPPAGIDWICVSPKAGAELILKKGNELKLVFPQTDINPADFLGLEFAHFCLQPMDELALAENTRLAVAYCLKNPRWTLSLQIHKILNIS